MVGVIGLIRYMLGAFVCLLVSMVGFLVVGSFVCLSICLLVWLVSFIWFEGTWDCWLVGLIR
jgi:hypothetical protein